MLCLVGLYTYCIILYDIIFSIFAAVSALDVYYIVYERHLPPLPLRDFSARSLLVFV